MSKLEAQAEYWKLSAERNWRTAMDLFKTKHYDACLFFCHLTLEKSLKALVIRTTNQSAPYIHNLERLANLAKLSLSTEQILQLRVITTFNIAGRYDEEKLAFYKKCSQGFTNKHLQIAKKLYLWLKGEYLKK